MAEKDKTLEIKSFYTEDQSAGAQSAGKKYLFRLTSPDGTKERRWELSPGLLKFGVFSMAVGVLLLIGTGAAVRGRIDEQADARRSRRQ